MSDENKLELNPEVEEISTKKIVNKNKKLIICIVGALAIIIASTAIFGAIRNKKWCEDNVVKSKTNIAIRYIENISSVTRIAKNDSYTTEDLANVETATSQLIEKVKNIDRNSKNISEPLEDMFDAISVLQLNLSFEKAMELTASYDYLTGTLISLGKLEADESRVILRGFGNQLHASMYKTAMNI